MNLLSGQEQGCRHKQQTCGHTGGKRGWDRIERIALTYTTMCKIYS